jgi:hypothetical protein
MLLDGTIFENQKKMGIIPRDTKLRSKQFRG